ncbi:MAG: NUDIX domain-containing protein [Candidatus Wildermuthbacteria bacterium]|nr:NUDIX domain-containing protein [Candidatus Wildermuthbacteria bacterium]
MARLTTTVGVFVALFNPHEHDKLLVRRRVEEPTFQGNWDLPGGGVEEAGGPDYDHLVAEGFRELEEEVGIEVPIIPGYVYSMYAAFLKGKTANDLALVIPIASYSYPTRGETRWVSVDELNAMAREFISLDEAKKQGLNEARGLVSGWGKRMHRLALSAFTSMPSGPYLNEAVRTLYQISTAT